MKGLHDKGGVVSVEFSHNLSFPEFLLNVQSLQGNLSVSFRRKWDSHLANTTITLTSVHQKGRETSKDYTECLILNIMAGGRRKISSIFHFDSFFSFHCWLYCGSGLMAQMLKECWICYQNEKETPSEVWVHPCTCRGGLKWCHQKCLLGWIDEKQKGNSGRPVRCPQCLTEYAIVYPRAGWCSYFLNIHSLIHSFIHSLIRSLIHFFLLFAHWMISFALQQDGSCVLVSSLTGPFPPRSPTSLFQVFFIVDTSPV
jgi:hypothetical protein